MKHSRFFIFLLFLSGSCREHTSRTDSLAEFPQVLASKSYTDCYNAVGFFRANMNEINSRLPKGFTARDGSSILGPDYKGYSFLVFIYFSCPSSIDSSIQTAIIATPIEEPSLANDLRTVRWNWYEFARIAGTSKQAQELSSVGLSAQYATLSNTPFHEGDTVTFFKANAPDGLLFEVGAKLTDSVNFEAQSHRLWHQRSDGHLVTTRLDFEYHHSWIGKFKSCSYNAGLLTVADLKGIECTHIGITEAIESINFTEHIMLWR